MSDVVQKLWGFCHTSQLIGRLSIDMEDFDDLSVFSREDGWGGVDGAFTGRLRELIGRINVARMRQWPRF
jgi:hypothetical protein